MSSRELTKSAIKASGLAEKVQHKEYLKGLAEVAAYLGISISGVRSLRRKHGLPAPNLSNFRGGPTLTSKVLLDQWYLLHYKDFLDETSS